ncbi:MAG: peptide deformylase [Rickettsiales bacterium]|nr:peptide deformylase [Rickettsiales bacterium]|tara:strand:- start:4156 stop:4668 length:513 start_codon:yes stop_codon:yes gene_type:complete
MKKILYVPHPVLRKKSLNLKNIEKEDLIIANEMMEIMINAPGVGLAANQIGVLKKIVTINIQDEENKIDKKYILFNPKIISYSKDTEIMEEGCLSLPKQYAKIERPKKINLEYLSDKKKLIKREVSGIEARVLQHEIDHLSGKLFIDYLSSLKRNIILKKVKKLIKNGEV